MKFGLLDPALGSANLGDQIIRQSVVRELEPMVALHGAFPTQRPPAISHLRLLRQMDGLIVGGTNLLSSNRFKYKQWRTGPSFISMRRKVVLMGVGWWQYQEDPDSYSEWFYRQLLDPDSVHSARDAYTQKKLESMGFAALNTGCPTMWSLSSQPQASGLSSHVVTTLTDYNKDLRADRQLLEGLRKEYRTVTLWPQSHRDLAYLKRLECDWVEVLPSTLAAYEEFLVTRRPDYVGTRLHAGIRALHEGCFVLIYAVDNRATEIGRDTGLNVRARETTGSLSDHLGVSAGVLSMHYDSIESWKAQFSPSD